MIIARKTGVPQRGAARDPRQDTLPSRPRACLEEQAVARPSRVDPTATTPPGNGDGSRGEGETGWWVSYRQVGVGVGGWGWGGGDGGSDGQEE